MEINLVIATTHNICILHFSVLIKNHYQ